MNDATTPISSVQIDFDTPVNGSGWYAPANGMAWTGPDTQSTITIPYKALSTGDTMLHFRVARVLALDIMGSVQIRVNGESISAQMTPDRSFGLNYEGIIPKAVLDKHPGEVLITFQVSHTVSPQDVHQGTDSHKVGLLFDWLQLSNVTTF